MNTTKNNTHREVKPFTTERLLSTIDKALEFAKEKNFVLKSQTDYSSFKYFVVEKLTKETSSNMRKKFNKSLRRLEYKMTRKNINLFFHYLNTRLELKMPIKFNMPVAEQELVASRENYKMLKKQLEEARVIYVGLKKSYYGTGKDTSEYMEKN